MLFPSKETALVRVVSITATGEMIQELVEKLDLSANGIHRRLKPDCNGNTYGTTEVVPLITDHHRSPS
jgi:hypothetical protein